ncbi:hypothetical protein [Jejubacter calystegiae]|nr:hypothetical protein [Jejubacter calystegiae]
MPMGESKPEELTEDTTICFYFVGTSQKIALDVLQNTRSSMMVFSDRHPT